MIIYLAGKITGNPEYRKQFAAAKAELEAKGYIVLNPAELPEGMSKAAYMRICFAMIDTADGVCGVGRWTDSRGAIAETSYADYIGKPIRNLNDALEGWFE